MNCEPSRANVLAFVKYRNKYKLTGTLKNNKKFEEPSLTPNPIQVLKNIAGTLALCGKTPLAALLAPRQILFGSMTVLVAFYVTGQIVPATVGLDSVLTAWVFGMGLHVSTRPRVFDG